MRVLGLVVEYNPFHFGHLYHLGESHRVCQPDLTIAVMSGNFTQRGEAGILDKWARAEMAVRNGVDVVFELPVAWAVCSADEFALGSMAHLDSAGATHVCFGSESGSIEKLREIAGLLQNETDDFRAALHEELNKGMSYPLARHKALSISGYPRPDLKEPNNILAIAYLRALAKLGSSITPLAIKRQGAGFHDTELSAPYASATAIRKAIHETQAAPQSLPIPVASQAILTRELSLGKGPVALSNYYQLLRYNIRVKGPGGLSSLPDLEPGLVYRLVKCEEQSSSLAELLICLKTKRYTWTRLQRLLCHTILGLDHDTNKLIQARGPQYLRLLALRKDAAPKLKALKTKVPIITRVAQYQSDLGLSLDIRATNIYVLGYPDSSRATPQQDLTRPPVIIE